MKTIYLCGPIFGCDDRQCKGWRREATERLRGRYAILDPMIRDYRGIESGKAREIVEDDYADIARSDIILALSDEPSWGTAMEIHQAFFGGKAVVSVCRVEHVSPWLSYHSSVLFRSLDRAIEFLLETP